jgi:hypothetical protein
VIRSTMALLALVLFLPTAPAALTPHPGQSPFPDRFPDDVARAAFPRQEKDEFVLAETTEIQLDGKACKLADVPAGASIVNLEIAADKKTILKIHFKSKK